MVNYKQSLAEQVDVGGFKHILKSTDKIIMLYAPLVAILETLHNSADGSNYIVPSGKKAKIVYIINCTTQASTDKIISSATLDSADSSTTLYHPQAIMGSIIFVSTSIPAGQYITKSDTNATNVYQIYILEEDA